MMSTGKEEISKLSDAVDETAKVVHELKTELHRRRSRHRPSSISPSRYMQLMGQGNNVVERLKVCSSDTKAFSSPGAEDGEGASSILTEELLPEGSEMERLEAELESELQKLPSFVDQALDEGRITRDCSEVHILWVLLIRMLGFIEINICYYLSLHNFIHLLSCCRIGHQMNQNARHQPFSSPMEYHLLN